MQKRAAVSKDQLRSVKTQVDKLGGNVVVIPEGFPGADEVRKNIEDFLRRNQTKVAHLIMVIHEDKPIAKEGILSYFRRVLLRSTGNS